MELSPATHREEKPLRAYIGYSAIVAIVGTVFLWIGLERNLTPLALTGALCALIGLLYLAALSRPIAFSCGVVGITLYWISGKKALGDWDIALWVVGSSLVGIGVLGELFRSITKD